MGDVLGPAVGDTAELVALVFGGWEDLVGPAMARHVHPHRVDGVTLVVVADHGAWASEARSAAGELGRRLAELTGNRVRALQVRARAPGR